MASTALLPTPITNGSYNMLLTNVLALFFSPIEILAIKQAYKEANVETIRITIAQNLYIEALVCYRETDLGSIFTNLTYTLQSKNPNLFTTKIHQIAKQLIKNVKHLALDLVLLRGPNMEQREEAERDAETEIFTLLKETEEARREECAGL